ncbi:MAG: shikimate kinase [Ignavibacterium sp.]|nr:shikimate kinase [Ignavibacterium sp.]MCX7611463.1 shikimate kinase [Ignavibacterium sp.]MDW8374533.1 shikimate kinase [Ignavibacteriales bacterium]
MKKELIFLIGFMTAGKSTIGKILANTLGWNFIDLDQEIEKVEGKSIDKIFRDNGEEYFRNLESMVLNKISSKKKYVIALGGGTVERPENFNLIKKKGIVIYLEISTQEALRRLRFKRNRPVLFIDSTEKITDEELLKRINNIFEKRLSIYEKADVKINTDKMKVGNTVDRLVKILYKDFGIE